MSSQTSGSSCQAYPNTGTVSSSNAPDASDSATTTVLCPDVSLVKTADADTVNAGAPIGFTITITETGGADAKNVQLAALKSPVASARRRVAAAMRSGRPGNSANSAGVGSEPGGGATDRRSGTLLGL